MCLEETKVEELNKFIGFRELEVARRSKLFVIKGRELVKFLESLGFRITMTKGSHVRLRSRRWKGDYCYRA